MKTPVCFALALALSWASVALGQSPEEVKAKVKDVKTQATQTPDFQLTNVGNVKRWKQKEWLEVDIEFEIDLAQSAGGRDGTLDIIQVNLYLALNAKNDDGKRYVAKATQAFQNVPASEDTHVLFFMSPATLKRIFEKDNFLPTSDIQGWGVELVVGGEVLAGDSSLGNQKWWESADNFAMMDGVLVTKNNTPFAPLWGDYDLEVSNP
jgi:hypothetical protein